MTVLSIVDCPVRYDAFRRGVVAVPNDRTGIITMPSCEEATRLSQYAKYSGWSPITGASFTDALGQQFAQPLPLTFSRVPPEVSITKSINFRIQQLGLSRIFLLNCPHS